MPRTKTLCRYFFKSLFAAHNSKAAQNPINGQKNTHAANQLFLTLIISAPFVYCFFVKVLSSTFIINYTALLLLSTKNSLSASGQGRSGGSLVLSKIEYLGRLAGRGNFEEGTGINLVMLSFCKFSFLSF